MPLRERETDLDPAAPLGPWRRGGWSPIFGPASLRGPITSALRWAQDDATRSSVRQAVEDGREGAARVVRSTRLPTRVGVLHFFTHQLLVNLVAWTAGLMAAGFVTRFFEVRGIRNFWGLMAPGSRTLVSPEDYRLILSLASFCAGLLMMIFVRHFILRWLDEVRSLRRERSPGRVTRSEGPPPPPGSLVRDFEELEFDPEP